MSFNKTTLYSLLISIVFLLSSCASQTTDADGKKKVRKKSWSYHKSGTTPEHWATIAEENALCASDRQSPIDIDSTIVSTNFQDSLDFEYESSIVELQNTTLVVQVRPIEQPTLTIGDINYNLQYVEIHAQSEHTIDKTHYPIELEFVHKNTEDNIIIVSVFIKEKNENNAVLSSFISKIPLTYGYFEDETQINFQDLIPSDTSYYRYEGSFTTPPCTKQVIWYILKNPISASKSQISILQEILNNNNRPTQTLDNRTIIYSEQ